MHIDTTLQISRPWFHDPKFFSSSTSFSYSHHPALSSLHNSHQLCWHGVQPAAVWIDKLEDNPGISLKPDQLTVRATIQLHRYLCQHSNSMQINIFIECFIPKIQNLVVYIFEKFLNSSAYVYAYSQVRGSIYKIKSNLTLILSLRNKYIIIQRLNKSPKLLLKLIKTTDREILILEITFLKGGNQNFGYRNAFIQTIFPGRCSTPLDYIPFTSSQWRNLGDR